MFCAFFTHEVRNYLFSYLFIIMYFSNQGRGYSSSYTVKNNFTGELLFSSLPSFGYDN